MTGQKIIGKMPRQKVEEAAGPDYTLVFVGIIILFHIVGLVSYHNHLLCVDGSILIQELLLLMQSDQPMLMQIPRGTRDLGEWIEQSADLESARFLTFCTQKDGGALNASESLLSLCAKTHFGSGD